MTTGLREGSACAGRAGSAAPALHRRKPLRRPHPPPHRPASDQRALFDEPDPCSVPPHGEPPVNGGRVVQDGAQAPPVGELRQFLLGAEGRLSEVPGGDVARELHDEFDLLAVRVVEVARGHVGFQRKTTSGARAWLQKVRALHAVEREVPHVVVVFKDADEVEAAVLLNEPQRGDRPPPFRAPWVLTYLISMRLRERALAHVSKTFPSIAGGTTGRAGETKATLFSQALAFFAPGVFVKDVLRRVEERGHPRAM